MKTIIAKLNTGETVIGMYRNDIAKTLGSGDIFIERPYLLGIIPHGTFIMPWNVFSSDTVVQIISQSVVHLSNPSDNILKLYTETLASTVSSPVQHKNYYETERVYH